MKMNSSGLPRMRAFLLLRYLLIIGAGYLIIVENRFAVPPVGISLVIAAALASNVAASLMAPATMERPFVTAAFILIDILWTTSALVLARHFAADFFYVYFCVFLLAVIGDNLQLVVIGAIVVCVAYGYVLARDGTWSVWDSPSVIRLPFLFIASAFYGYLIDTNRSDRRRAEAADRSARDKLEALAAVAHDIRTSVFGILGWTELLAGTELKPDQREYAEGAHRGCNALRGLIDDLLDVSKGDAGRLELDAIDFDVRSTMEAAVEIFSKQAVQKGLTFTYHIDDIGIVNGDGPRLQRILANLVSNAIKFTEHGTVSMRASIAEDLGSRILVRVEVADSGIGLTPDEQRRLFQPFVQVRQGGNRSHRGTGLGLAISKMLVGLMGGEIGVFSQLGSGSTFWFTAWFGKPASRDSGKDVLGRVVRASTGERDEVPITG